MEFEINYTLEELKERTSKERFPEIKLLSKDDECYKCLTENEKECLKYLCRAGKYIDNIHFKMENYLNEEFLEFLNKEIKKGNERAYLTKKLFLAQKSMFSPDIDGNKVVLCKNIKEPFGICYPHDLTVQEFHSILDKMIDENKIEKVRKILTQRSVVKRDDNELVGIDYVEEFKEEFTLMAHELNNAIKYADDEDFRQFLELQVKAITLVDPYLDAMADKKWAVMEKSNLEFTITRETYNDRMTESLFANEKLLKKIESLGIEVNTKDNLGVRIGIKNNEGTKLLYDLAKLVDIASEYMPYKNEYNLKQQESSITQTAVDVDVVALLGEEGAYQAGIVVAQNLPNNDKLSLKIGGGRKNVYHRQIRNSNVDMKLVEAKINNEFLKYFNQEASHWGTICHENTHSLGPDGNKSLGMYSSILEEFKADMGMYCFLDIFVEKGLFTDLQAKQIMVTELSNCFPKGKPELSQAHRVRSVMIAKRMLEAKAIDFDNEGKLIFNFEKIIAESKLMMKEVIRLQLDKNVSKAQEYVNKYFCYDENFERMANIQKEHSKRLNAYLSMPIFEELQRE